MLVGECLALPGEAVREFLALRGEAARELGLERLAEGEAVRDDVCEPGCEPAEEPLRNGSGSMVVGEPRGPCELATDTGERLPGTGKLGAGFTSGSFLTKLSRSAFEPLHATALASAGAFASVASPGSEPRLEIDSRDSRACRDLMSKPTSSKGLIVSDGAAEEARRPPFVAATLALDGPDLAAVGCCALSVTRRACHASRPGKAFAAVTSRDRVMRGTSELAMTVVLRGIRFLANAPSPIVSPT